MAGMRRADRLFRIVQLLRGGRLQTARSLAEKLQVSHRTIYRDVQDLQLSGMPITGEAGVGYTLRRDLDIPPLMFDREEIAALVLGARMVEAWGGTELTEAANRALRKIEAVLPAGLREKIDDVLLYAPGFKAPPNCAASWTRCTPPPRSAAWSCSLIAVRRRPAQRSPRSSAGTLFLGRHVDARRLVWGSVSTFAPSASTASNTPDH